MLLISTLDILETEVFDPTRQNEVFIRSCECVQASLGQSWGNFEDGNESDHTLVDCQCKGKEISNIDDSSYTESISSDLESEFD